MKKYLLLLIVLAVSVFLFIKQFNLRKSLVEKSANSAEKVSVILTGFGSKNDEGVWQGEIAPFTRNLASGVDMGENFKTCPVAYEGYLYGERVLVSSSGMGKVSTAACLTQILNYYKNDVKEVIFVGIAGISPSKGGILDESGNKRDSEPAMLGDVCINSLAFDFDQQHYTSDKAGSKTPSPLFWNQESVFSSRFVINANGLANDLVEASARVDWPVAPSDVSDINTLYHGASRAVRVWGPNECIEATGDLYWHDLALDRRAREIAADFMSQALGISLKPEDVLIVTSMEASSAGYVVKEWNRSSSSNINFAYVRSASNFDHPYLNPANLVALNGQDSVAKLSSTGAGSFAIETAALPVLRMFELRSVNLK